MKFKKPSATAIIAGTALFVSIGGGTAYAASQMLPDNSVGNAQLRNNAVTYKKINDGEVGYDKLTPGVQNALGNSGATGPQGPKGDTGATGPQGPQGPQGATGKNGTNGTNGSNGSNGTNGKDGYDAAVPVTSLGDVWVDHSGNQDDPQANPPRASGTSKIDSNGVELSVPNDGAYAGISTNVLNDLTAAQVSTIRYTASYTGGTSNNAEPYIKLKLIGANGVCGGDDVLYAPDAQNPTLSYPGETQTYDATAPFSQVGVDNDAQPTNGNYATAIHGAGTGNPADVSNEKVCLAEIIFDGGSGASGGTATISNVTFAGSGFPERTYVFGN